MPPSASSNRPFFRVLRAGERALLVAEQLRLDERLRQRRAAHLDERLLRAHRVVVDRVRDQLLARARLAAHEHRGVRARHLRDLLVHLAHRTARADEIGQLVALFQLKLEVRVLVEQASTLRLRVAVGLHRLRGHRRDDLEKAHELVELALLEQLQLGAERTDGRASVHDRHAHEAHGAPLEMAPARRPVQEERLLAHVGDDDRLGALHDATDNPRRRIALPLRRGASPMPSAPRRAGRRSRRGRRDDAADATAPWWRAKDLGTQCSDAFL